MFFESTMEKIRIQMSNNAKSYDDKFTNRSSQASRQSGKIVWDVFATFNLTLTLTLTLTQIR